MEFETWWLLGIPLFFGLGWIAARVDIKQLVSESRSLPRGYFKGLNFLLNEQPDKAIEAFIEVVKVDPETIELHFALGSLFRRSGEYDRAIRMHQNLLERAGLDRDLALRALRPLQERTLDVAGQPPTGPIARGDAGTVAAHLDAIGPELAPLYRALGRATLPLVDRHAAEAVADLL